MRSSLAAAVILTAWIPYVVQAGIPLGSAFTYNGQLKQAGLPYSGRADFMFTLYDGPTYGTAVGVPLTLTDITVLAGLFTVQLDFGTTVFNGDDRWIEVQVRTPAGSTEEYSKLLPRHRIGPVPYALQTRGMFVDADLNVGIGTTSPTSTLTVAGMIETTEGGVRFPDGSVQGTAEHGIQEYTSAGDYVWVCPPGVTRVRVEMWGAGGGGGGGMYSRQADWDWPGGIGGSGAYARVWLPVTPGQSYAIHIGAGGPGGKEGGEGPGGAGSPGGASQFRNPGDTALLEVSGGGGGEGVSSWTSGPDGEGASLPTVPPGRGIARRGPGRNSSNAGVPAYGESAGSGGGRGSFYEAGKPGHDGWAILEW